MERRRTRSEWLAEGGRPKLNAHRYIAPEQLDSGEEIVQVLLRYRVTLRELADGTGVAYMTLYMRLKRAGYYGDGRRRSDDDDG